MWIAKKEYNELIKIQNEHEVYKRHDADQNRWVCDRLSELSQRSCELGMENAELKMELQKYKQMYADEVQKRLALIKKYDKTN